MQWREAKAIDSPRPLRSMRRLNADGTSPATTVNNDDAVTAVPRRFSRRTYSRTTGRAAASYPVRCCLLRRSAFSLWSPSSSDTIARQEFRGRTVARQSRYTRSTHRAVASSLDRHGAVGSRRHTFAELRLAGLFPSLLFVLLPRARRKHTQNFKEHANSL
jgi:hypothetical protein